jgi:uncharacterized protein GlcG (DUF336 family)
MSKLTLAQANRIIEAALSRARELNLPPISVAVLDSGGHLVALQREDGQSFLRVQVCQAKAWGALGLGAHSRQIAERFDSEQRQQGFIAALNSLSGGSVIPLPGALLIRDDSSNVLGAVGVSGANSDDDEACAASGIEAIGFKVSQS